MRILFLDDDDRRHKEFRRSARGHSVDHARSAPEAIRLLGSHAYDRVYLDIDLADDPTEADLDDYESGRAVADWLADHALGRHDCLFVVHSRNDAEAPAVLGLLRSAGLRAIRRRWSWPPDPSEFVR